MRNESNPLWRCLGGAALVKGALLLASTLSLAAWVTPARAEELPREDVIRVPAIGEGLCVSNVFQSNMVIQRDKPIAIWGWAQPDEKVTVRFAGQEASATAGPDRKWKVSLPAVPVNATPQSMTIAGATQTLTLDNILVGDVWLLGGQSNMEFPIKKVENGNLEIASANFPNIRILTIPAAEGPDLRQGFAQLEQWSDWSKQHFHRGFWEVCTPQTVPELSAIGYVFARRIHMASQVPIGVVNVSRGGTSLETWTPLPLMRKLESPHVKEKLATWDEKVSTWDPQKDLQSRIERFRARMEKLKADGQPLPANAVEPADLQPGPLADANYPGNCYAGMIGPIEGLSVKGAIWHQGYNNAFDGYNGGLMYGELFPEMIASWRRAFNDPAMPFGILSLCTEGNPQTYDDYCEKMYNAGIYIRAAQYQTFLQLYNAGDKNIGYTATYDLRRRWYHPQLKVPAGERIARWALATQYGFEKQIEWKPPMVVQMQAKDGSIVLAFDSPVGDPEDGAIEGFAIAGEDRHFQPAKAERLVTGKDSHGRPQYDAKTLVLTSGLVPNPVHYRYAWGRCPLANLQATGNKDIPVATQRSDDWRMEEVPLGVLGEKYELPLTRPDQAKIINALKADDVKRKLYEAEQVIKQHGQPDAPPAQ